MQGSRTFLEIVTRPDRLARASAAVKQAQPRYAAREPLLSLLILCAAQGDEKEAAPQPLLALRPPGDLPDGKFPGISVQPQRSRRDDRLQRTIQYSEASVINPGGRGVLDTRLRGYDDHRVQRGRRAVQAIGG